jgi:hypothetical protein
MPCTLESMGLLVSTRLAVLVAVVLTVGACGSSDAVNRCTSACDSSPANAVATCQGLQTSFFAALPAAQSCGNSKIAGQCQKTVPLLSIGCSSPICMVAVNDDSALMPIETQWNLLGCSQLPGYGCVQGCRVARTGICVAGDGGAICDP